MRNNILLNFFVFTIISISCYEANSQNHNTCGFSLRKQMMTPSQKAMIPTNCSEATSQGYGPNCSNNDSTIPALPFPACGKFRVPIAFRQIANDDCTGVLPDMSTRLDQELCFLNQMFGPANIEFFECSRPDPICSTAFNDFDGDTEEPAINANNIPNVINIYLPTTVSLGGSSIGGYAPLGGNASEPSFFVAVGTAAGNEQIGSYNYSETGCTTNNSACSPTGNHWTLLAHEMGHYFGLNHTFETDLNGAGAGSTTELADGSNSCIAGDLHEDTAPDPYQQLADSGVDTDAQSGCSNSCNWSNPTNVTDANGTTYNGFAADNIMSYWNYDCTAVFSPFQTRRMYDVLQNCATYLCCNNAENYLSDVNQQNINVCQGDALPEITGVSGRCYSWYADATTSTAISAGTTNLSSSDFATAVNTATAGTYTIYVQDANSVANASANPASCRIPIMVTVNAGGTNGCASTCSVGSGLNIQIKAMLEGFVTSDGMMRNDLTTNGLIPNNQPFTVSPWNYSGSESVTLFPSSIVDWVLVRAYDTNENKLEEQACLITTNGNLINACDFTSAIQFSNPSSSIAYVSIHHKSHLAVIGETNGSAIIIDFTVTGTAIGVQQTKVVQGMHVLYAGDYDGNGIINNLDFNVWANNNAIVNSYVNQDADGNTVVNNLDYNFWIVNRSKVGESAIQL